MKNAKIGLLLAMTYSPLMLASTKIPAKVQIVAPSEDRAVKYQNAGLIGAFQGARTTDVVFMVNAIVNGDHARLKCYENHKGCTALGPGEYEAEIDKDNVWIIMSAPVTHKLIRDHWKVAGSW